MVGVRGKKSRRLRKNDPTKAGRKKKKVVKPQVGNAVLKQHWDSKKTLKQNMKDLGLAFNPNDTAAGNPKKKGKKQSGMEVDEEEEEVPTMEEKIVNTAVIDEFEVQASVTYKHERVIAEGEAKFLLALMKDHGTNYKAMARDKRNTYQHTMNHLKRKCQAFLKSPFYSKYTEKFPDIAPPAGMDTD